MNRKWNVPNQKLFMKYKNTYNKNLSNSIVIAMAIESSMVETQNC